MIKIHLVNKPEFNNLVNSAQFIKDINENIYIVKGYYSVREIDKIKQICLEFSNEIEPAWYPCVDDCPDYHRLHNNYPKAHVQSIQHAYYFHRWNGNHSLFNFFSNIFNMKSVLVDSNNIDMDFLNNIPSTGPIARVLVHQYPRGGGGQKEHIDPVSPYAKIQTIIQASVPNKDYRSGGLYINTSETGKVYLDGMTNKGDLIVMSPGIKHGVEAIDPECELDWSKDDGRWIIMPIIIDSDLKKDGYGKPISVNVGTT